MFHRIGLVLVAFAFFSIAGGHWAVVQTVAWAEMLSEFAHRDGSLAVAAEKTFDGQHPCALCREIQLAKSQERKESPGLPAGKEIAKVTALVVDSTLSGAEGNCREVSFPRAALPSVLSRTDTPPTPPPRVGDLTA